MVPNWLVYTKSWPAERPERDHYQWKDRALPPCQVGVEKFERENFSAMLVWNPETLFRMRNNVGSKYKCWVKTPRKGWCRILHFAGSAIGRACGWRLGFSGADRGVWAVSAV